LHPSRPIGRGTGPIPSHTLDRSTTARKDRRGSQRRTCGLLVLAALATNACVTQHGPIPWDLWRDTYPPDYAVPLAEKEKHFTEHLELRHLSPEGVLIYVREFTPFDRGREDSFANLSDTPIWTGAYAAALAFRYRTTGAAEDRARLLRVLGGLSLLHDVTGKPGLLARAIFPDGSSIPAEKTDGEWRLAPAPHQRWRYRGDVSKDQYFGVLFGYAATSLALGIDSERGDAEIRAAMSRIVAAIADHFWENGFRIVDVDGEMTSFGNLDGNMASIPIGPNAGLVLGFEKLAERLTGATRFRERYQELIDREWHHALGYIKFELPGWINHNNDNMGMMALYALTGLEREPEIRGVYDKALAKLWNHVRFEGNTFFNLIYATRYPLPERAKFDSRENLALYPLDPRIYGFDLRTSYADRLDLACFDDRFGRPHNRTALPMHLRRRGDFVWKLSPFAAAHPKSDPRDISGSGFDFILAYWMARVYIGDPEDWPRVIPENPES
jgi:hypothetical protein